MKEVYTTGDVARICRISQQTVIRVFDERILKGFVIPGCTHRRVPHASLVKFMQDSGIPLDWLPQSVEAPETAPVRV